MTRRPLRAVLLLVAAFAAPLVSRAHLPTESAMVVSADEENLIVTVSLSLQSAAALLPRDAKPLTPGSFESHRAALRASSPRACSLLDATDAVLAPERVFVSLHDDHEVRYQFLFARSASPARLRMPLLASLPATAFCEVSDRRSPSSAAKILSPASPDCSLVSPAR